MSPRLVPVELDLHDTFAAGQPRQPPSKVLDLGGGDVASQDEPVARDGRCVRHGSQLREQLQDRNDIAKVSGLSDADVQRLRELYPRK